MIMRRVIISCPTLKKELDTLLESENQACEVCYIPSKLHSDPNELRSYLQDIIDRQENVDQILLCVSGCGGATRELKATTAELVIPKAADCIDVLLSGSSVSRQTNGIFLTESWMESFKNSSLDYETMTRKIGKERAEERLKTIYNGFNRFYVIDTGTYNVDTVKEYILPLVEILNGTLEIIPGNYGILRKIVSGCIDDDFQVVPKGSVSV